MTVTLTAEVQVATVALRSALTAVTPHADAEEGRVRLVLGVDDVEVLASNGLTAAMALAAIEEDTRGGLRDPDDAPLIVDITPRQAKLILKQFALVPGDTAGQLTALRVIDKGVGLEVADVSGLFPGESIRFPGVGVSDHFPDVTKVIAQALADASSSALAKPLTTDGAVLALFKAASVVYEEPLTVEATGTPESRGFLVSCGDLFLGVISSRFLDDDSARHRDKTRLRWMSRLIKLDPVAEAKRQLAGV